MALNIGVSGHRAMPHADLAGLRQAAHEFFSRAATLADRLLAEDQSAPRPRYRREPPVLRCLCGLAEGADTLFADAALDAGCTLTAILAFTQDEFARDFAGPALAHYRSLLDRAADIVALDGSRAPDAHPYAAVGDVIVERSDILLVVWDGHPSRGPGGTGDVVAAARRHARPLWILPDAGPVPPDPAQGLDAALRRILMPPEH